MRLYIKILMMGCLLLGAGLAAGCGQAPAQPASGAGQENLPPEALVSAPLPGPWGVIRAKGGLWAVKEDGSGLTKMAVDQPFGPADWPTCGSPSGGGLAYLVADSAGSGQTWLKQVTFADSKLKTLLAAKPAGSQQPVGPVWSPDGTALAFTQSKAAAGGGGEAGEQGVWWLRLGDQVPKMLPAGSKNEALAGWATPQALLVYSLDGPCGPSNLRQVALETGKESPLWPGTFSALAHDPQSGALLVGVKQVPGCDSAAAPGAYLVSGGQAAQTPLVKGDIQQVSWNEMVGQFLVQSLEGWFAVQPGGSVMAATPADLPIHPLPGLQAWAWYGGQDDAAQGLWVGIPARFTSQVFKEPVRSAAWSPDGTTLFVFADDGLWVARGPVYTFIQVGPGLLLADGGGVVCWVKP